MPISTNEEKNTSREIDNSEVNNFRMNEGTFDDQTSQSTAGETSTECSVIDDATESIDVIVKDAFARVCDEASPSSLIEKLQKLVIRRL